ncbi:putative immunoglobulin-blocking virulence protein [Mycoplasmopsis agalactiae]|uniref:putative immunoglobulin-blocking virulence protein n=1 Tax=Mycoplasmopsis agalactiae TaxID=2110 RepID=UPI00211C504F|nr:putative immunoglobulin-blocking virulence protein [Mycoplasmopsis agalactiae]UUM25808.1 putative immunoglobulin-blocking virulence protein [Mycoplasmopsis agalactiae]
MKILKTKKNRILMLSLLSGGIISASAGVAIYKASSDFNLAKSIFSFDSFDSELANSNNVKHTNDSIRDKNITEKVNEPIKAEEPKTEPIIIKTPKAEESSTAEPPKETIKPIESQPIVASPTTERRKITLNGVEVYAIVEVNPDRKVSDYDRNKGIANRDPYQSTIVNKLVSVEVTDELRKSTVEKALTSGEGDGLFDGTFFKVIDDLVNKDKDSLEVAEGVLERNSQIWESNLFRYKELLDSENVTKFLKPGKDVEYEDIIKNKGGFKTQNQRYIWLISNLDKSKFTKLADTSNKYLNEGLVVSPRNAKINANGEIDAHAWSPSPEFNTVTSRYARDNSLKRVFGYNSYFWRSPDDTEEGNYPGWKKTDATSEFSSYGVSEGDGITVHKLERIERIKEENGQINEGYVVNIDAKNPDGYAKTKKLIEDLKKAGKKITSYRIKNMGEADPAQKFKEILAALPDDLPQLELFFSANATNTSSLIALENKKIKELSLYTLGNSLLQKWSFNPWAFKNTAWINTNDYNVSYEYGRNKPLATRITFDTIAFDQEDYKTENNFERINDGLRLVYYARNNERAFQGSFGPGLNPDHAEGDNSYPVGLDFSRVPNIKSLRGLEFHDSQNPSNKARKIKRLTLFNNSTTFEISGNELNQASFHHIMEPVPGDSDKPKIMFSNGDTTNTIKISSKERLSSEGLTNLNKFFQLNDVLRASKKIIVPEGARDLISQLQGAGFNVETGTEGITYT